MLASPAHAADPPPPEVILSVEDYATLVGLAGQVKPLQAENAALTSSLANMTEQRDLLTERVKLKAELAADYKELADIRRLRAEEAEARGDRIAREKRKEGFYAKVRERALEGALLGGLGGTAVPGIGNLVGTIGGGAVGAIWGALEAWAQGP